MADESLGDLIIEMKLDDLKYRQQVKQTLTETQSHVRAASSQASAALTKGFNAREATQSLKALHGSMYLLTGETGFMVITAGQAAINIGKLATASGGLAPALSAAAAASKSFLAAIGPVGVALLAAGAAYQAVSYLINKDLEEAEKRVNKLMGQLPALLIQEKAARENALARGTIGTGEARVSDLMGVEGMTRERALRIAAQEEDTQRLNRAKQGQAEFAANEARKAQERKQAEQDIADIRKRNADEFWESERRHNENRRKTIVDFEISHGLKRPSDAMSDPVAKMLAKFSEDRAAIRANAQAAPSEAPAFGIGTVSSSGFRFGAGAFGSVIGQQTEQAKTNDLLKSIDEETKKQAEHIAAIARTITSGGSPFSLGVPFSGLPGL